MIWGAEDMKTNNDFLENRDRRLILIHQFHHNLQFILILDLRRCAELSSRPPDVLPWQIKVLLLWSRCEQSHINMIKTRIVFTATCYDEHQANSRQAAHDLTTRPVQTTFPCGSRLVCVSCLISGYSSGFHCKKHAASAFKGSVGELSTGQTPTWCGCYWLYVGNHNLPCWAEWREQRAGSGQVAAEAGPVAADWAQAVLGAGLVAADWEQLAAAASLTGLLWWPLICWASLQWLKKWPADWWTAVLDQPFLGLKVNGEDKRTGQASQSPYDLSHTRFVITTKPCDGAAVFRIKHMMRLAHLSHWVLRLLLGPSSNLNLHLWWLDESVAPVGLKLWQHLFSINKEYLLYCNT